jgi:hypothetical protein
MLFIHLLQEFIEKAEENAIVTLSTLGGAAFLLVVLVLRALLGGGKNKKGASKKVKKTNPCLVYELVTKIVVCKYKNSISLVSCRHHLERPRRRI